MPIALTIAAFLAGYGAHKALAPQAIVLAKPKTPRRERADSTASAASEGATDTDSDYEDEAAANAADLGSLKPGSDEIKLVLVVNDSLKMSKGKIGAQCGHATLACYETLAKSNARVSPSGERKDGGKGGRKEGRKTGMEGAARSWG